MAEQSGFACGQLKDAVATNQAWEDSRESPLGGFSLGDDLEKPGRYQSGGSQQAVTRVQALHEGEEFVLFDDVSPTPRTRWKHFCGVQEALNKYLMNE